MENQKDKIGDWFKKYGGILFIIILISFYLIIDKDNLTNCSVVQYQKGKKIIGIVNTKYKDTSQHNYETIVISENKHYISGDKSGLYQYIQINDSIVKNTGTLSCIIYRNQLYDTTIEINYACDSIK